ncbi:MAG: spore coat U domain-containing protein [Acidobacteriota bacterium]|nr:spore coat U domain-containing protein [Acidobacteriota bacterium]
MRRILFVTTLIAILFARKATGQNCSFSPAPASAAFGNYSVFPSGPPQTTTPTFNVDCSSNNVRITVTLSRGINSASFNPRTMKNGGGILLNYNLYVDAANTQIWGDGTGGSVSQSYTTSASQNGLPAPVPIYASLPLGQNVGAGSYTDTVTATLSWMRGANPASTTATFNVTATVVGDCTVSAFSMNFGSYEPVVANAALPLDSTATINVYCTSGTTGSVALDNGSNFSAGKRQLKSAAGVFMTYEIYKDSGRTTVWNAVGINSATSANKAVPLGGGFIAYGRIAAGQDIQAGAYNDTLQATVTY